MLRLVKVPNNQWPSDCIPDPEKAFAMEDVKLTGNAVALVKAIEEADLNTNTGLVQTRTGVVHVTEISTSSKIALLLESGFHVTLRECGTNGLYWILRLCTSGVGYFSHISEEPSIGENADVNISLNGVIYNDLWDVAEEMFIC